MGLTMAHDETMGWIFTDDYHDWQDQQKYSGLRPGRWPDSPEGLGAGLFMIKDQDLSDAKARWPAPFDPDDLGEHP